MKSSILSPVFVDFIPERLDEGTLYISRRYRTASHLCCCGCGLEVVTPLNPAKWQFSEHPDGTVSLSPSVGNWSFPCKSHYIIGRNQVVWAGGFSPELIRAVQARDLHDAQQLGRPAQMPWIDWLHVRAAQLGTWLKSWFR